MDDNKKIAIIGAGLAGLTAAYRLFQQGIHCDIFEARNRVGGRVHSAQIKNYQGDFSVIEFGGQSITDGGEKGVIFQLTQEMGLSIKSQQVELNSRIYYQGHYYDFDEQLEELFKQQPKLIENIHSFAEKCITINELISMICKDNPILELALQTRMTAYEGIPVKYQSIYHNLDTLVCALEGGLSKSQEYFEHEAHHITIQSIQGGNAQLPIKMTRLLENRLHLNKVLLQIEKIDHKFHLFFQDKSSYAYDWVILATPCSTYKNITLSKNIPIHDRWKKMQSVSVGENYKTICPFNLNQNLPTRTIITQDTISFFTQDQDVAILYSNNPIKDLQREIQIIEQGYEIKNHSAPFIIEANDDIDQNYTNAVTYSWINNPYSLGSYSGYSTTLSAELDDKTTHNGEIFKTLFKPTSDGLCFIGEHTTLLEFVGTMEAAAESGNRIARWISTLIKNDNITL